MPLDGNPVVWEARYDALGRRTTCRWADQQREFYWDGDRLAAEELPGGRFRVYQYATREALVPLGFVEYPSRDASPPSGRSYVVFSEPNGMPARIEDESGEAVWSAKRSHAFGTIEGLPSRRLEYNLRWAGHYYDPETGLQYNRYRYYDPALGRYLQSDPLGYGGSPVNLYAYCANPVVQVDLLGLNHSKKAGKTSNSASEPDGQEKPPHSTTPLNEMTHEQMKETCQYHADRLAALQEPRPERRNMNTYSVGVIEDSHGNRRLAATSNMNVESGPNRASKEYMQNNGISNESNAPPRLTRQPVMNPETKQQQTDAKGRPVSETVNADTGKPYDKKTQSAHHAEQRMGTVPKGDEKVAAQCPSQPCCPGCQSALSQPDASGQRPIDNIPAGRQGL
jgi:RHS repeat-associated protein